MSISKEIIVFIGPPGSGKGSLSNLCINQFGWIQLSTGFLCRKHIAEQTEIGKQIDFFIKSGKLITDSLVIAMVDDWLITSIDNYKGVVLDGFPRTIAQAEALDIIIQKKVPSCRLHVIKLSISDDCVVERLSRRFICKNKDCQMVYSMTTQADLGPKKPNECDYCTGELVRRPDDDSAIVRERLKSYHSYEKNLLNFFVNSGKTITQINVEKPLYEVFEDFKKMIGV